MEEKLWQIPSLTDKEKKEFSEFYNRRSVSLFRIASLVILITTSFYFYLDYLSAPHSYKILWILRAIAFVSILILLVLSFFSKEFFIKHFQFFATSVAATYNIVILLMIYFSTPEEMSYYNYYSGLMVILSVSVALRVRYKQFVFLWLITFIPYLYIAIYEQNMLEGDNIKFFINNMFFLISTFLAIFIADYVLEIYIRKSFLASVLLREQNAEILQQKEEIKHQRDQAIEQKKKIEEQNYLIQSSLRYARGIQNAILPSQELISVFFENFIIFKPKELVSGDFYLFRQISRDNIYIAAADCTGHGIPGAFISMLGASLLNELLTTAKSPERPDMILNKLRERVKKLLHQDSDNFDHSDGLDIALVSLDIKQNKIFFSGANNPIYIVRKNKTPLPENKKIRYYYYNDLVLIELKADKMPIGIFPLEQDFQTIEFGLQENDMVYMFSDGFIDQLNIEQQKFMSKNFKKLLCKIYDYPTLVQAEKIENELEVWKQGQAQTDDILVLGIKYKAVSK